MKKILIIALLFVLSFSLYSKEMTDSLVTLTVVISNIRSDEGNIRVHLYEIGNQESFPDKSIRANQLKITNIINGKAVVSFDNLNPSTYAFTVHHDENLNVKMDRNLIGIPTEGWALSNNIKPLFKLPTFRECSFELKSNKRLLVSINY